MAWRIRWRQNNEERNYTLMREQVALWTGAGGEVLLEGPQDGWEWATLLESGKAEPVVRWHHPPTGVKLRRDGEEAAIIKAGNNEWIVETGDELWFSEQEAAVQIVAMSSSVEGAMECIEDPGKTSANLADEEIIGLMWKLHRELAKGKGWSEVLELLKQQARKRLGMEGLEGSAALIWEGECEFYHRVVWPREAQDGHESESGPRRAGALASLLTRERDLQVALRERGEVVVRHHSDESIDLLLPIGSEEFLGAFYLVGASGVAVDSTQVWSLVNLFGPAGEQLTRRYRMKQKMRGFEEENRYFRERERRHYLFKDLVCESEVMRNVYDELHDRVDSEQPLLMTGEAGTGKELLARALHHLGGRQEGMLIRMGCANFPEELVDFELFGCVASELTGAVAARKGIFELAEEGTVFLDEIDRLSPMMQGKLVRVIKEREVRRIGDAVGRPVEARFIASSHRDLEALCRRGKFRRDLYELLVPHKMYVPPLRKRGDDILPLARIFMRKFASRYDAECQSMDEELRTWLVDYRWPGNVRQLQTFIEAAVLMAREQEVIERQSLILHKVEVPVLGVDS